MSDCKLVCPRCHTKLKRWEFQQMAPNAVEMANCELCHRWWRHCMKEDECGLVGTIKEVGQEVFTPCWAQQGELFH